MYIFDKYSCSWIKTLHLSKCERTGSNKLGVTSAQFLHIYRIVMNYHKMHYVLECHIIWHWKRTIFTHNSTRKSATKAFLQSSRMKFVVFLSWHRVEFHPNSWRLNIFNFHTQTWLHLLPICTRTELFFYFKLLLPLSSSFFILLMLCKPNFFTHSLTQSISFHRVLYVVRHRNENERDRERKEDEEEIKFKLIDVLHDNALNEIDWDVIAVICSSCIE